MSTSVFQECAAAISLAACSALERERQPSSTRAPRPASTLAVSSPMPVFAPVMKKVLPDWSGTSLAVKSRIISTVYATAPPLTSATG